MVELPEIKIKVKIENIISLWMAIKFRIGGFNYLDITTKDKMTKIKIDRRENE